MSMNRIHIDPVTAKQIFKVARDNFEEVAVELLEDYGEETLEDMAWVDLAELFYTNGYINGVVDTEKSEELREIGNLMNEEIDYQKSLD